MRELLRPFVGCRLCWQITFAVFALILAVEAAILFPSARQFDANERQRIADHAQILVEPLLARAHATGERSPSLEPVLGRYGVVGISLFAPGGMRIASAGDAPPMLAGAQELAAAARPDSGRQASLLAAWRSASMEGHSVVVRADASELAARLRAYVLRIAGLVVIIVLVVTVGTMLVMNVSVLRPLLRLRASSIGAGSDPGGATRFKLATRRRDEIGQLIEAYNAMLDQVAERSRYLASHDPLTGLPNRAALIAHLDHQERAGAVTLLLINVPQFHTLNAGYGTAVGDRLIRELAARLKATGSASDFIAHLGADRFALAISRVPPPPEASSIAERILRALAKPFEQGSGVWLTLPVRIGIAQSAKGAGDGQTLLAQADLALERTYGADDVAYQFFSPSLAVEGKARQGLARDLEHALERSELFLALQPRFRLADAQPRAPVGAEVLLRWRHASRGLVSPAEFIPLAESTGLIVPLGDFVLREACAQLKAWLARYRGAPRLAVNLSAHQFSQRDLVARIERGIEEAAVPADLLELEITETAAMRDVERTSASLAAMRALGVHVSIDDFGTGYSSLNYLRRFTVDAIKIDKSFVDDIGADHHAEAICDAILRLGHSLGTKVVAEGVEKEEQARFLRRRRCDEVQGYLYGRPMAAEDFERLHMPARVAPATGFQPAACLGGQGTLP
jgi:diguanylate cyclase (GGDEF)-like protein